MGLPLCMFSFLPEPQSYAEFQRLKTVLAVSQWFIGGGLVWTLELQRDGKQKLFSCHSDALALGKSHPFSITQRLL